MGMVRGPGFDVEAVAVANGVAAAATDAPGDEDRSRGYSWQGMGNNVSD